jgi:hypothetical protein
VLFFDGAVGLVFFGVWVFCIIDVITQPEHEIRNLPKLVWLLIVILLMDVGSIAWLVAGRPWHTTPQALAKPRPPGRATNPDDDAEFLAQLHARAEEQRRRARETPKPEEPEQNA